MQYFTGLEYLRIDIANHFGLDKISFESRLDWIQAHEKELEQCVIKAKDPFRYTAALMAYRKTQAGKPTGYMVGLDACASGVQVMSAIMRDPVGCANTGLIGQKRQDIYAIATTVINDLLENTSNWIYEQPDLKVSLMCHYYGSKAEPKKIFGKDTIELQAFQEAQAIVAPGAAELLQVFLMAWQANTLEHNWVLPDNFHANIKVIQKMQTKVEVEELDHAAFNYIYTDNFGTEKGVSLAANIVHSIDGYICRELCRRCNYKAIQLRRAEELLIHKLNSTKISITEVSKYEQLYFDTGMISLVGIESLNTHSVKQLRRVYVNALLELIQETLIRPSFPVITIHDEFKCHPNYMNWIRQTYIDLFAELSEGRLIQDIVETITDGDMTIEPFNDDIGDLIRKSEYALS